MVRVILVGILASFSAACAAGGAAGEERDGVVVGNASMADIEEKGGAGEVSTSNLTWQLDSTQNCVDFYTVRCNQAMPSPQCNVVAGQSCSQLGDWCYKVMSGDAYFRAYQCL